MAPQAPGMSITLPRNFAPMGLDGADEPKTPDQSFAELKLPPPPHHSTQRIRRPRINMDNFTSRNSALPTTLFASDIPIPSVEVPRPTETARPAWYQRMTDSSPSEMIRLPAYRMLPSPQTPPAQTKPIQPEPKKTAWDMERPSSSCSTRSDSSLSSDGSFISRPTSFGGSATSPESDFQDPFLSGIFNLIPDTPSKPSKTMTFDSAVSATKTRWTIEMDNHLWNVYQMYLADPTVTPFKTAPGAIPPPGVRSRVARVATQTWPKATKVSHQIIKRHTLRDVMDESFAVRDRTPLLRSSLDSREDTPRVSHSDDAKAPWPGSSATRRRLKELCKQKFSITPHYQRLRESRSPSPFTDQFSRRSSSSRITRAPSRQSSTSYATRDLGISLVASGATGPLAQLVTGDSPEMQSDDWFNTPVTSSSQTNDTPPSGLGIHSDGLAPASSVPRLASPFSYNTWNGPTRSRRNLRPELSLNYYETISAAGPRLLSPVRLDPFSCVQKRRAPNQLDDQLSPSTSHAQQQSHSKQELVFTGVGDISQRRIRLRNRGATMGAMNSRDRLDRLFTPPPTLQQPDISHAATTTTTTNAAQGGTSSGGLAAPEPEDRLKRLGSPFELDANKRSNRSKSPRHVASLSDPFVSNPFATTSNTQSIGERLAAFSAMHQGHDSHSTLF